MGRLSILQQSLDFKSSTHIHLAPMTHSLVLATFRWSLKMLVPLSNFTNDSDQLEKNAGKQQNLTESRYCLLHEYAKYLKRYLQKMTSLDG